MPIAALPDSTARAIASTSALSDACAVVKELLDNALDASASSVSVEISLNTIDLIQVKDNGHGISPEDHQFVCRRAYTSKIQTLDDLKNVGGQSLGFRGEALASAAEMASSITLSTRAQSQVIGSLLKYDCKGALVSNEKSSQPVGTTICVMGFLKHIPVRRQIALKCASKTLAKIKKLLQAYAMAKPSTRLSLKVLRGKNESNNWVYAPTSNSSLRDATIRVLGAEIASQCIFKEWKSAPCTVAEKESSFKIAAFLPKVDADFTKAGSSGQFLSVDGRPLSLSRGTPKDIISLYKSYIRSAVKTRQITVSLSDPFLCLHISCPKGSYDANVEPAKDDVLFADPEAILSLSESMFMDMYGSIGQSSQRNTDKGSTSVNDDFSLLMARRPAVYLPASPPLTNPQLPGKQKSFAHSDIVPCETTPRSSLNQSSREPESSSDAESDSRLSDKNSMNPWTLAKTHFFRSTKSSSNTQLLTPIRCRGQQRNEHHVENSQRVSRSPVVPNPSYHGSQSSSPADARTSPSIRSPSHASRIDKSIPRLTLSKTAVRQSDRERYGNGALDTWFQNTTQRSLNYSSSISPTTSENIQPADSDGADSVMLDDTDDLDSPVQPSKSIQKPFNLRLAPTSVRDSRSSDILMRQLSDLEERTFSARQQEFPVMEEWSARLHEAPSQSHDSEIEEALDFERRKRAAILARREQIKNSRGSTISQPISKSPHQNRYLAAKAALTAGISTGPTAVDASQLVVSPSESSPASGLERNDPRAHLMHYLEMQQSALVSEPGIQPKRTKTNRLPLEKIPDGFDIHDLALVCALSLDHLVLSSRPLLTVDSYTQSGNAYEALSSSDVVSTSKLWESTLVTLLQSKYRKVDGDGAPDIQLDILAAIRSSH